MWGRPCASSSSQLCPVTFRSEFIVAVLHVRRWRRCFDTEICFQTISDAMFSNWGDTSPFSLAASAALLIWIVVMSVDGPLQSVTSKYTTKWITWDLPALQMVMVSQKMNRNDLTSGWRCWRLLKCFNDWIGDYEIAVKLSRSVGYLGCFPICVCSSGLFHVLFYFFTK